MAEGEILRQSHSTVVVTVTFMLTGDEGTVHVVAVW